MNRALLLPSPTRLLTFIFAVLLACSVACGGGGSSDTHDAGDGATTNTDAGEDASVTSDASTADDATTVDAAGDDAGEMDASETDASAGDAGIDSGTGTDSGVAGSRDVVRPKVTVEKAMGQADPTSTPSIRFAVVFDEPIATGTFDVSDLSIDPSVSITVQIVDSGDHRTFEAQLTNLPDVDENYILRIADGRVLDLAGNPNEPSTSVDNSARYDATLPSVEVKKWMPIVTVTNTLPITFIVIFQVPITPAAAFDASDVMNGGTASGVTWQVTASNPGTVYFVSATAVTTPGTVFPVVTAAAATDAMARPTLASVYIGDPVMYTTLPILKIGDAQITEGGQLTFIVTFAETTVNTVPTIFDWSTTSGTAVAGTDFVAASAVDVTIPTGGSVVGLNVSATPNDTLPEPHEQFTVHISNVRGNVYVMRDTATGTIINNDNGTYSLGANSGSSSTAQPDDIRIYETDVHTFGEGVGGTPYLQRRDSRSNGPLEQSLSVTGYRPGGMDLTSLGYFVATTAYDGGYTLYKFANDTDDYDDAFGNFGSIDITDPVDFIRSVDVAADDSSLFVLGQRTTPAPPSDSSWFIERRSGTTAALVSGFGTGGVLPLDRVVGAGVEAPITAHSDGTSLFVLGHIANAYRMEKRAVSDGALVSGFGASGVLELTPTYTRVDDFALYAGALYVIGRDATSALVTRLDGVSGATNWQWHSPMDDPKCISVASNGLYIGGARGNAAHMERWMHDSTPIWARTFLYDRMPSGVTAIVFEEGSFWLHAAAYINYNGHREWYYDRRYAPDGFLYVNSVNQPQN